MSQRILLVLGVALALLTSPGCSGSGDRNGSGGPPVWGVDPGTDPGLDEGIIDPGPIDDGVVDPGPAVCVSVEEFAAQRGPEAESLGRTCTDASDCGLGVCGPGVCTVTCVDTCPSSAIVEAE